MSCLGTNTPCGCGDPCSATDINNCYDDCGCLNPTTFNCITSPPPLQYIPVTSDMNGAEVLSAINNKFGDILESIGTLQAPTQNSADIFSKVSSTDTSTGYLEAKVTKGQHINIVKINTGNNEQLRISVTPNTLISKDKNNSIYIGVDGLLKVDAITPAQNYLRQGNGISITGSNTQEDPYIISAEGFLQAQRSCFDGQWRSFLLQETGIGEVNYVTGQPKFRIRHDGAVEFKGNVTYTVQFSEYNQNRRKFTINAGGIGTTCLNLQELTGVSELKSSTYIDSPQASADQMTQAYGYIIRKNGKDLQIEFQSSFTTPTTKTVVVSFDGAVFYPNI